MNSMLVCRYWRDIMLSTPGFRSRMWINDWTEKKYIERFERKWLLDVTVHAERWGPSFDPLKFHACFMAAADRRQH